MFLFDRNKLNTAVIEEAAYYFSVDYGQLPLEYTASIGTLQQVKIAVNVPPNIRNRNT